MRGKKIVIFGWYGTETLGDKAILGGIVKDLLEKGARECDLHLLSLNVNYTKLTLIELNFSEIGLSDFIEKKNDIDFLKTFDLFIMGGGPLCDIEDMVDVLEILHNAKKLGKETIIQSCGIGPLNKERYRYVFREILNNSDSVSFRDFFTPIKYNDLIREDKKYMVTIDPAVYYIQDVSKAQTSRIIKDPYIMFCLRDWPKMYAYGIEDQEYELIKSHFEEEVVRLINFIHSQNKKIIFFPMHNYYMGDDDREYFLLLIEKFNLWEKVIIIGHDYSIEEAVNYFKFADCVLGMRFHSVVFSLALETTCLSIDYQLDDGKITGLLNLLDIEIEKVKIRSFKANNIDLINLYKDLEAKSIDWEKVNKMKNQQILGFKSFI